MKELITVLMVLIGSVIGIYLIIILSRPKQDTKNEQKVTAAVLNSILGNQLKQKKKLFTRIILFQFLLLFGYTLVSVWLVFDYQLIRIVGIFLLLIELIEVAFRLIVIKRAKQLKSMLSNNWISKCSPYIYLVGIAILIGTMI